MSLCSERGRFLYEVRPDIFPAGRLADAELQLWGMWYAERDRERKRHSR
jgi:hypothetical protein